MIQPAGAVPSLLPSSTGISSSSKSDAVETSDEVKEVKGKENREKNSIGVYDEGDVSQRSRKNS